ncbi:class I SAM-dependent methyltransferase [Polyangium sp. 6x1]|nr:class I SAM-dependent methyltransferase [Polyangium sp. 6x1]MDI1451118.1 class I SAM-dependent methyltransferase [Polyangium sp. 6x1]
MGWLAESFPSENVEGLPAGTALDVGCGLGADAIWLAHQGWRVTAVDISHVALDRARAAEPITIQDTVLKARRIA